VIIVCATGKSVIQVPSFGVGAPAGEILVFEVDADAHRTRRRLEQAEHELAYPQAMSSTVVTSVWEVRRPIIRAARPSESGPWKVSRVVRGGPSTSSITRMVLLTSQRALDIAMTSSESGLPIGA
jgi:hypothetical protein